MTARSEMVRDQSVIAESHVVNILCQQVCKAASNLSDVYRRAERAGDATNDLARSVGK